MDKVQIHGIEFSTYTRTARIAAIEKDIKHDLVPIDYGQPSHLALHPFGKMPALTHGSLKLIETLAIVSYLDDLSGHPTLFGATAIEKAEILSAISVAVDYAYRPVVQIETEDGIATAQNLAKAAKPLDWLEVQLAQHTNIVGDALTAADLFFAPMLTYHAQQVGDAIAFAGRPRIKSWLARTAERGSYATTGAQ